MTDQEVSPDELARRYLVTHDYNQGLGPEPQRAYRALSIWEEWITSHPDKAWGVCEELVRLRPDDDDVLEQLCHRLELLLSEHWEDFHDRVAYLVASNPRLTRIMPPAALSESHYAPKYRSPVELSDAWLEFDRHFPAANLVHELGRDDPERALTLALELIHRAPLYQCTSFDVMGPLLELLRQHGLQVIERVEVIAGESVAVRRVLWRMRPQQPDRPGTSTIYQDVWERVLRAAGDTTDYNSDDPRAAISPLEREDERIVASWFVCKDKDWASEALNELVREDPDKAWAVVELLVERADSDELLGSIAAGPLEDLLRKHGAMLVSRVEEKARRDLRFKRCLGGVWLDPRDLSDEIIRRLHRASDGELRILEPRPTPHELLELERQAVTMLLTGAHRVLEALREQWSRSTVAHRSYGWGGGHVEFSVPADVPPICDADSVTIGDVCAEIHFLDSPVLFFLLIEDGRLAGLNCTIQGDWPDPVLVKRVYWIRTDEHATQDVETSERDLNRFRRRWGE